MSRNFGPGGSGSEASTPGGRPGRRRRHRAGRDRRGGHVGLPPPDRAVCRGPRRGGRAGGWALGRSGRAAGRGRGEISVVAVSVKKKKKEKVTYRSCCE